MPESSASAGAPVAALAARAFSSAFSANVSPVSGGSSTRVGQRLERGVRQQAAELAELVGVAGGEHHGHRRS